MTEDQNDLLRQARDSLAASRVLLDTGFPGFAASRAYYAMFYVAEAFLEGEGKSFSKHSGVISAFGRDFAHAGRVPAEFHRYLLKARETRDAGDYGEYGEVSIEEAKHEVAHAEAFLQLAEQMFGPVKDFDQ